MGPFASAVTDASINDPSTLSWTLHLDQRIPETALMNIVRESAVTRNGEAWLHGVLWEHRFKGQQKNAHFIASLVQAEAELDTLADW